MPTRITINTLDPTYIQAQTSLNLLQQYLRPRLRAFAALSEASRAHWLQHDPLLRDFTRWAKQATALDREI